MIAVLALLVVASTIAGSFSKTSGGQVAVVRNGGPFDNNRVRHPAAAFEPHLPRALQRGALHPRASATTPSPQTPSTVTGRRRGRADADQRRGRHRVEGTFYRTLTTDQKSLTGFDNRFGTRTYLGQDGTQR